MPGKLENAQQMTYKPVPNICCIQVKSLALSFTQEERSQGHRNQGESLLKDYEYTTQISCHDITSGNIICAKLTFLVEIDAPILRFVHLQGAFMCLLNFLAMYRHRFNFQQYRMHTDFDEVTQSAN